MYKDLFKVESMQKPKRGNLKSYSNKRASYAKSFAVCFAIVTLASCGEKTGNSMFQTVKNAADAYRSYLSEVRKEVNLPTDRLIEKVNDWQSLRDSVSACVAKDTTSRPHQNPENTVRMLHDSLRIEFTRLALSQPRSFADVLLIREQTSRYRQDTELMRSAAEAEPFFKPLDSVPTYKGRADAVVEKYRMFLSKTLKSGISGKSEMLAFIKEEDWLFRSFLSHLPELADADMSAIADETEKCYLSVFQSAEDGKISYREALVYTARRTNRRIILNALACRDDINQGNVKTEAQARAYVWMLLQPYVALDGFSVAILSDMERTTLHAVADRTPQMIAKLNKTAGTDNDQWQVLPGVLIKIMLTSI